MNSPTKALLCLLAPLPCIHAATVILGDTTGDPRGVDAFDAQSYRDSSTQVASGDYAVAVGGANESSGESSSAVGFMNWSTGERSSAVGYSNSATDSDSVAFGSMNSAFGTVSGAFGSYNYVYYAHAWAFGSDNQVGADHASVFGSGIVNQIANSTMIGPSDAAKVTILSSGNVGIGLGNTSPSEKLEVGGNAKINGTLTVGNVPVLTATGSGAGLTGLNASALTTGTLPTSVLPSMVVQTTVPQTLTNKTLQDATLAGYNTWAPDGMVFGDGRLTVTSGNTNLVYNGSGQIIIGYPDGAGEEGIYLAGEAGYITLNTDGGAAISGDLIVGGGAIGYNDKVVVGPLNSTHTRATLGAHTNDLSGWADLNIAGTNLLFRTNGETEAARFTSSGDLGVGTSTPAAKLDVNGTAQFAGDIKVKNRAVIRVSPAGDIDMGDFTSGTNPEL